MVFVFKFYFNDSIHEKISSLYTKIARFLVGLVGRVCTVCWLCLKKLYDESNRVIRAPRLIDIPGRNE